MDLFAQARAFRKIAQEDNPEEHQDFQGYHCSTRPAPSGGGYISSDYAGAGGGENRLASVLDSPRLAGRPKYPGMKGAPMPEKSDG